MIKTITHKENCDNRVIRHNTPGYFTPETGLILSYEGEYFSQQEFAEKFPVHGDKGVKLIDWHTKKHNKGENPNRKNNFRTL